MRTIQELSANASVSAVIPTLNAADTLAGLMEQLAASIIFEEIIVVDGGSSDETTALARAAGAHFIAAPRGRGVQLAVGAGAAAGDWLLFLHADCRLSPDWEAAVAAFLAGPEATGRAGYFDFALADAAPAARRLERIVAWRCRVLGLPYGDQGLLIARSLYRTVGGFAPLPLMEDVDLVRRLGRGRLARIGAQCISSPRRYHREGYWRRPLRNLFCLSLYFAGVSPYRIARLYG
ncbi:MAG: TIGR04283 family arsenosugar biosynthesis glycosyltransferase [Alphaproteobacteria bacterium]|nr:TIGR04283 family arsenosugar biosynthesis glycosyltransferase [Alphaproteobacteria bacterium]